MPLNVAVLFLLKNNKEKQNNIHDDLTSHYRHQKIKSGLAATYLDTYLKRATFCFLGCNLEISKNFSYEEKLQMLICMPYVSLGRR